MIEQKTPLARPSRRLMVSGRRLLDMPVPALGSLDMFLVWGIIILVPLTLSLCSQGD